MNFSKNLTPTTKCLIKELWGMASEVGYATYLGLPQIVGQSKKKTFSQVKQRDWQKNLRVEGETLIPRWL